MGEVRYSINGKYFKDYNVLISSSDGIGDGLKRKKVNTYDWTEYNGLSVDLSSPKFEAREITLKGFVIGSNWDEMMENFNTVLYEFQKPETQRLLIEPFNMKPRPYEVYMEDSSPLEKTFKDGQMVGVFTLKLIEPNPIKKVLYLTENTLNLSYNSSKETEIFFVNGEKTTAKGNVSLSGKTLANRVVSGYDFGGRNLFLDSEFKRNINSVESSINVYTSLFGVGDFDGTPTPKNGKSFSFYTNNPGDTYSYLSQQIIVEPNTEYVLSFWQNGSGGISENSSYFLDSTNTHYIMDFSFNKTKTWERKIVKIKTSANATSIKLRFGFICNYNAWISIANIQFEKGNKATDWTPAPEDEKYIIIAGNVDEITDLITNAEVLWEKL